MKLFSALSAAFALASASYVLALPSPQSKGKAAPPPSVPEGFNITSLNLNGSGCPPGSTYYVLNEERTAVTVTFSQYYAEAGPGIPISANRKNCRLTFGVKVPAGFTFGIATVDYVRVDWFDLQVQSTKNSSQSAGTINSITRLLPHSNPCITVGIPSPSNVTVIDLIDLIQLPVQGLLAQATARSELVGPVDGADYLYRDKFDLASMVLAPCGSSTVLNIQTDLRASNAKNTKGSGYIATDSIDTTLKQTFNFHWQTCKK
ncbi:hypothetical protein CC1G_11230 [Coprinopsis cinerea okayama7|uniref:Secreted protein n=1 Tax=Coprinopsis cinerea (strain Okayama-7 / 130 / ATCC MYA-4618 / FGSC 9003) TaxID=240176 RepID=A8N129_COPC7|nr:hypothetical protein CC1G_11230 [Coprinopsis cinerea okayama7\|eukprot:XP_001828578.2 hypothetical protein CC1G_11230 [Coprinopsis cinerea okayama7\